MSKVKIKFRILVFPIVSLIIFPVLLASCGSKIKLIKKKSGNVEIVEAKEGKKIIYRLVYTYAGNKIIKGEHWLPADPEAKKDPKAAKKTNIFSGTAIAKKLEKLLSGKKIIDESDIKLSREESGFVLNFVQKVKYNRKGLPRQVIRRGYTKIPILGFFNLKTDLDYKYNGRGKLMQIKETNINVDTLLMNFAIGNITTFVRDGKGRPVKVIKAIGSIPPAAEVTTYSYWDNKSPKMKKTVYQKVGLNGLSIRETEKITVWYSKKVPWIGQPKYHFNVGKNIWGLLVWDSVKRKNKLDGSNFMKMNYVNKALFMKGIYDLVKMEMQGPKWRMGELPDVPMPFLVYGEYAWYN